MSKIAISTLSIPNPATLSPREREVMLCAGLKIQECYRVLSKVGLNVVGEILRSQGTFTEMEHYPQEDVFDHHTYSQYYYHAHHLETQEHGHFHCFMRAGGMPVNTTPLVYPLASESWPQGDEAIAHLVGIAMDAWGYPIGLFTTNRWVTGETGYPAETVIRMLPNFAIDHAWPSWPVNRWITAMLCLFRHHITALLLHRDEIVNSWQESHPGKDVLEDRQLEITGYLPISVEEWLEMLGNSCA